MVQDLRLESSGNGYLIWGRVDNPQQLGQVLVKIQQLELTNLVRSEIVIDNTSQAPIVSLLKDNLGITLTGTMPTLKSKSRLIEQLKTTLEVNTVRDLISTEANVSHGDWQHKIIELAGYLPASVYGITIDPDNIMLTGSVEDNFAWQNLDLTLARLFPDRQRLNWVTISDTSI